MQWLAEWRQGRERANALARAMRDAADLRRGELRRGLLLQVPSFYR